MRGKPTSRAIFTPASGITPADAGKTYVKYDLRQAAPDHPRGCGENWLSDLWGGIKNGSPPRMRGKPKPAPCPRTPRGITPADAGKTRGRLSSLQCCPDHPRGCGENQIQTTDRGKGQGSPPRMRGKPSNVTAFDGQPRITPADAGKTLVFLDFRRNLEDHPRGCGENFHESV